MSLGLAIFTHAYVGVFRPATFLVRPAARFALSRCRACERGDCSLDVRRCGLGLEQPLEPLGVLERADDRELQLLADHVLRDPLNVLDGDGVEAG